jgi:hypothetical protein
MANVRPTTKSIAMILEEIENFEKNTEKLIAWMASITNRISQPDLSREFSNIKNDIAEFKKNHDTTHAMHFDFAFDDLQETKKNIQDSLVNLARTTPIIAHLILSDPAPLSFLDESTINIVRASTPQRFASTPRKEAKSSTNTPAAPNTNSTIPLSSIYRAILDNPSFFTIYTNLDSPEKKLILAEGAIVHQKTIDYWHTFHPIQDLFKEAEEGFSAAKIKLDRTNPYQLYACLMINFRRTPLSSELKLKEDYLIEAANTHPILKKFFMRSEALTTHFPTLKKRIVKQDIPQSTTPHQEELKREMPKTAPGESSASSHPAMSLHSFRSDMLSNAEALKRDTAGYSPEEKLIFAEAAILHRVQLSTLSHAERLFAEALSALDPIFPGKASRIVDQTDAYQLYASLIFAYRKRQLSSELPLQQSHLITAASRNSILKKLMVASENLPLKFPSLKKELERIPAHRAAPGARHFSPSEDKARFFNAPRPGYNDDAQQAKMDVNKALALLRSEKCLSLTAEEITNIYIAHLGNPNFNFEVIVNRAQLQLHGYLPNLGRSAAISEILTSNRQLSLLSDLQQGRSKIYSQDAISAIRALLEDQVNPLTLLGIAREDAFTSAALKKAFRAQSMVMHPDKGGDENLFKQLNTAYKLLTLAIADPDLQTYIKNILFSITRPSASSAPPAVTLR